MFSRRRFLEGSLASGSLLAIPRRTDGAEQGETQTSRASQEPAQIPVATFRARVAAVQRELGKQDLDGLVITSVEGYDTRYLTQHAPGVVLVPASGEPTLFTGRSPQTWLSGVEVGGDLEAWLGKCAERLKELGAQRGKIGISGEFAWAVKARLGSLLPGARFEQGDEIQDRLRLIKDEYELRFLRRAQQVSDAQIRAGQAAIRPGRSDREVLADLVGAAVAAGADINSSTHFLGYGPGTADLWAPLTGRRIGSGEVVNFEGINYYGHYVIETPVTFAVGKVSQKQKDLAKVNFEAFQAGVATVKAGTPLGAVVEASNAVLKRAGFDKMIRRHGHFSGMANNDSPSFDAAIKSGLVLRPGMTMSYHTTITAPTQDAIVIVGRELLVTEKGSEVFSQLALGPMVEAG